MRSIVVCYRSSRATANREKTGFRANHRSAPDTPVGGRNRSWQFRWLLISLPRRMTRLRAIVPLTVLLLSTGISLNAQQEAGWEIQSLSPEGGAV